MFFARRVLVYLTIHMVHTHLPHVLRDASDHEPRTQAPGDSGKPVSNRNEAAVDWLL